MIMMMMYSNNNNDNMCEQLYMVIMGGSLLLFYLTELFVFVPFKLLLFQIESDFITIRPEHNKMRSLIIMIRILHAHGDY